MDDLNLNDGNDANELDQFGVDDDQIQPHFDIDAHDPIHGAPFGMSSEFEEIGSHTTLQNSYGAGQRVTNYRAVEDLSLFQAQLTRCCQCGVMTPPNASNTCLQCLKAQINVTEGISKHILLNHCKECNRYKKPPWTLMEPESS